MLLHAKDLALEAKRFISLIALVFLSNPECHEASVNRPAAVTVRSSLQWLSELATVKPIDWSTA
jgi:hypothetical protein